MLEFLFIEETKDRFWQERHGAATPLGLREKRRLKEETEKANCPTRTTELLAVF